MVQDVAIIHGRDAVKPPRFSIARLMAIVGVVAFNGSIVRAYVMECLGNGILLSGLALQVGLLCWIRCRAHVRPFWAGFEVVGLASVLAILCIVGLCPEDSAVFRALILYYDSGFNFAYGLLCKLITNPVSQEDLLLQHELSIAESVFFVPHLLVALAGGFVASLIAKRRRRINAGARASRENREPE
jgi:hypothetical protein